MKQLEKARKYEELYKELFDRNSKVTTICLLLCGAFWVLKLYVLSEQCLILFFLFWRTVWGEANSSRACSTGRILFARSAKNIIYL